eukprot:g2421.t1
MAIKYKELDIFKLDIIARELKALDTELGMVGKEAGDGSTIDGCALGLASFVEAKFLQQSAGRLKDFGEQQQIHQHGSKMLDQCLHIGAAIDDPLAAGELKDGGVMSGFVYEEVDAPDHGSSKAARLRQADRWENNIPGAELQALAAKLPATARFVLPEGLPASQTMVATQMTMERAVVPENRKAAAAANAVPRAQAKDSAFASFFFSCGFSRSDATPAPAAPGARGAGHDTHSVSIASGLQATIDNQMFTRSRAPVVCLAPDGGMLQRQHSPSRVSATAQARAPFHKKLYWKQVDIADAEGTIFSEESRRRANTCSAIDFNALSKILEAEKTKGSQLQRRSSGVLSKAQMRNIGTKVLSDHRARNIAIVLKRMPTSTTELVRVLSSLQWEDDRISSDDLEQILEAIPTQDEAKKLREHSSPEACQKLRDVEQMVMPLTLLNRASARVRVLCIARNVRLQFKSTMRSLARIRAACLAIQKSGMLRNVMLLALQLGNFINHGDSTKGAKAIAIGSLLALRDFKCGEGISTLHFLCASLMRSGQPDAAQVLQRELQPAERIAKMQVQGLSAGMKAFERDLDSIKSECRNYLEEYEGGGDDAVEPLT